jgi:hypothetical protein
MIHNDVQVSDAARYRARWICKIGRQALYIEINASWTISTRSCSYRSGRRPES